MPTYNELMEMARRADKDGDTAGAGRLVQMALKAQAAEAGADAIPPAPRSRPVRTEKVGMGEDVAKAAGAGFARGATGAIDFAGEVAKTLDPATMPSQAARFMKFLQDQGLGIPSWAGAGQTQLDTALQAGPNLQEAAAALTGGATEYRGKSTPAQYAGTVGEFAGGAAAMPVGGGAKAIAKSLLGAAGTGLATEAAGQTARVFAPEQENLVRLLTSVASPVAGAAATPFLRRMALGSADDILANTAGQNLTRGTEFLRSKGIDVAPPQAIGSPKLTELTGMYEPTLSQKTQLTRAALREIGETGDVLATQDVLAANRRRIGEVFDRVDAAGPVISTESDAMRALQLREKALEGIGENAEGLTPRVTKVVDEFFNIAAEGGTLTPKYLKQTKTSLAKMLPDFMKKNKWADYELAQDMMELLDDTVQRNLTRTAPELIPELRTAREQYRSLLTLERAVNRGGKEAARGFITPAALASSVRAREGIGPWRGRKSSLAELSEAASPVLLPDPTVRAGGERVFTDAQGNVNKVKGILSGFASSSQMPTLEKTLSEAMFERLLRGAAPRLGGISQTYGER